MAVKRRKCRNCGQYKQEDRYTDFLCRACYEYKRSTGKKRPANLWSSNALCDTCHNDVIHAKRECRACYTYRRTHGVERPSYLWQTECRNCGAPLVKRQSAHGRCAACAKYYHRNKTERPSRFWIKYCECGAEAKHTIVSVGEWFDVCDECFRLAHQE